MTVRSPVGIVGLGLMGGSLARALARLPDAPDVVAWSRDRRDLELAREAGVVQHAAATPEEAAAGAALVVYAVPLGAILEMIGTHRRTWPPDAVITDVAGLKTPVLERARAAGVADRFVGSHPMTGAEASGFAAARAGIYQGVPVWITDDTGDPEAHAAVAALWRAVGADPRRVGAEAHDRRMVWASHLPQLASNALAGVLEEHGLARADLGPGGHDMTRLAASSPGVWLDLLDAAGPAVASALEELSRVLERLAADLREGRAADLEAFMDTTRRWTAGGVGPAADRGGEG
jgi:prephenate dehydrogenase